MTLSRLANEGAPRDIRYNEIHDYLYILLDIAITTRGKTYFPVFYLWVFHATNSCLNKVNFNKISSLHKLNPSGTTNTLVSEWVEWRLVGRYWVKVGGSGGRMGGYRCQGLVNRCVRCGWMVVRVDRWVDSGLNQIVRWSIRQIQSGKAEWEIFIMHCQPRVGFVNGVTYACICISFSFFSAFPCFFFLSFFLPLSGEGARCREISYRGKERVSCL